jgi:hypothetical protein
MHRSHHLFTALRCLLFVEEKEEEEEEFLVRKIFRCGSTSAQFAK